MPPLLTRRATEDDLPPSILFLIRLRNRCVFVVTVVRLWVMLTKLTPRSVLTDSTAAPPNRTVGPLTEMCSARPIVVGSLRILLPTVAARSPAWIDKSHVLLVALNSLFERVSLLRYLLHLFLQLLLGSQTSFRLILHLGLHLFLHVDHIFGQLLGAKLSILHLGTQKDNGLFVKGGYLLFQVSLLPSVQRDLLLQLRNLFCLFFCLIVELAVLLAVKHRLRSLLLLLLLNDPLPLFIRSSLGLLQLGNLGLFLLQGIQVLLLLRAAMLNHLVDPPDLGLQLISINLDGLSTIQCGHQFSHCFIALGLQPSFHVCELLVPFGEVRKFARLDGFKLTRLGRNLCLRALQLLGKLLLFGLELADVTVKSPLLLRNFIVDSLILLLKRLKSFLVCLLHIFFDLLVNIFLLLSPLLLRQRHIIAKHAKLTGALVDVRNSFPQLHLQWIQLLARPQRSPARCGLALSNVATARKSLAHCRLDINDIPFGLSLGLLIAKKIVGSRLQLSIFFVRLLELVTKLAVVLFLISQRCLELGQLT
mmetsp:Transcript_87937/g.200924  ORF Transcript_87937/g.200924 Transcript_87937/m.200924 type:complete len:534 (-) Transcript_87937:719-2320(-)